jgi:hypothetical protein
MNDCVDALDGVSHQPVIPNVAGQDLDTGVLEIGRGSAGKIIDHSNVTSVCYEHPY